MKYICENCGRIVDEEDLRTYRDIDMVSNIIVRDEMATDYQCSCGGDFIPAYKCERCGEYYDPNSRGANEDYCSECAKEIQEENEAEIMRLEKAIETAIRLKYKIDDRETRDDLNLLCNLAEEAIKELK